MPGAPASEAANHDFRGNGRCDQQRMKENCPPTAATGRCPNRRGRNFFQGSRGTRAYSVTRRSISPHRNNAGKPVGGTCTRSWGKKRKDDSGRVSATQHWQSQWHSLSAFGFPLSLRVAGLPAALILPAGALQNLPFLAGKAGLPLAMDLFQNPIDLLGQFGRLGRFVRRRLVHT